MLGFLFSIYDEKAHAYMPPWCLPTVDLAIREFVDLVNDPESKIFRHQSDYTLFCVGEFDNQSGVLSSEDGCRSLGNGVEFIVSSGVSDVVDLVHGEGHAA